MPGFLLHAGATVLCAHGGQASPTAPFTRVTLSGQPVATMGCPYTIVGCPMPPPPPGTGPCVTGQWLLGATRVFAGGMPVLLQSGNSVCVPTPAPMTPVVTQTRVTGQ